MRLSSQCFDHTYAVASVARSGVCIAHIAKGRSCTAAQAKHGRKVIYGRREPAHDCAERSLWIQWRPATDQSERSAQSCAVLDAHRSPCARASPAQPCNFYLLQCELCKRPGPRHRSNCVCMIETLGGQPHAIDLCAPRRICPDRVASCVTFLAQGFRAGRANGRSEVPRFEPAPCRNCRGRRAGQSELRYLVIPENRSQPTARTIRLMVAKYPARSPEKQAIRVYLAAAGRHRPPRGQRLIAADFIRDRTSWW